MGQRRVVSASRDVGHDRNLLVDEGGVALGMSGWTLGSGFGSLTRKHGVGTDNLIASEVEVLGAVPVQETLADKTHPPRRRTGRTGVRDQGAPIRGGRGVCHVNDECGFPREPAPRRRIIGGEP